MKKTAENFPGPEPYRPILPSPLSSGDTIGLVAPAGSIISKKNFRAGIAILEKKGFQVRYSRRILEGKSYLAGSDRERADEFNRLWSDPEIKGLVAARGGYGSLRMLPLIDLKLIKKNPKMLIGFSDLSILLAAVSIKTGLVTYHGPVVTTLAGSNPQSLTAFFNVLTGKSPFSMPPVNFETLKKGTAGGIMLGGNLTTLVHSIGTPYEIPWHRTVLFIEDTGEAPYRLDRCLTHLYQAGCLRKIQGLILGSFTNSSHRASPRMYKTVQKRVLELLAETTIPVWSHLPVGHGRQNITLPVGVEVEMDSRSKMLRFI